MSKVEQKTQRSISQMLYIDLKGVVNNPNLDHQLNIRKAQQQQQSQNTILLQNKLSCDPLRPLSQQRNIKKRIIFNKNNAGDTKSQTQRYLCQSPYNNNINKNNKLSAKPAFDQNIINDNKERAQDFQYPISSSLSTTNYCSNQKISNFLQDNHETPLSRNQSQGSLLQQFQNSENLQSNAKNSRAISIQIGSNNNMANTQSNSDEIQKRLEEATQTLQSQKLNTQTKEDMLVHNLNEQEQQLQNQRLQEQFLNLKNQELQEKQSTLLLDSGNNVQQHQLFLLQQQQQQQQQYLQPPGPGEEQQILNGLIQREQQLLQMLENRCSKLHDLVNIFSNPAEFKFENPTDFQRLKHSMSELSISLVSASKTEISLGLKMRELEKANIEKAHLQQQCSNLTEKNSELQKIISILQQKKSNLDEDNNKLMKYLNIEKKKSRGNSQKVGAMQKRIEFILENDININLNSTDRLRITLNELLRENESLKRDLAHKNQELERQSGQIQNLNVQQERMTKKLDNIRKNPSAQKQLQQSYSAQHQFASAGSQLYQSAAFPPQPQKTMFMSSQANPNPNPRSPNPNPNPNPYYANPNYANPNPNPNPSSNFALGSNLLESQTLLLENDVPVHQQQYQMHESNLLLIKKKDDLDLLHNFVIPQNLDFRFLSLKKEAMTLISDIMDLGSFKFATHTMAGDKEKEESVRNIQTVADQFLGYREVSEKLTWMVSDMDFLRRRCARNMGDDVNGREEIAAHINTHYAFIFNSRRINLWLVDQMTGLLCSYAICNINTSNNKAQNRIIRDGKCCTRALYSKGIIGEVFANKEAVNVKNAKNRPLLYVIDEDVQSDHAEYAESTLIVPVFQLQDWNSFERGRKNAVLQLGHPPQQQQQQQMLSLLQSQQQQLQSPPQQSTSSSEAQSSNSQKIIQGVLEISDSNNEIFNFDDEYFAIILSHYIAELLDRLDLKETLQVSSRLARHALECYGKLLKVGRDRLQFQEIVKEYLRLMFGIGTSKFFFFEEKTQSQCEKQKQKQQTNVQQKNSSSNTYLSNANNSPNKGSAQITKNASLLLLGQGQKSKDNNDAEDDYDLQNFENDCENEAEGEEKSIRKSASIQKPQQQQQTKALQKTNTIEKQENEMAGFLVEIIPTLKKGEPPEERMHSLDYGLAGMVAKDKKAVIVNDVKFSSGYNQLVDLYSLLPVYVIPLVHVVRMEKGEDVQICYGVLEVTLKHQNRSALEKDQLLQPSDRLFGLQDPLEIELKRFLENIVLSALMQLDFQNKGGNKGIF